MVDDCNRLVVEIKQGEARGFGFTIQQRCSIQKHKSMS